MKISEDGSIEIEDCESADTINGRITFKYPRAKSDLQKFIDLYRSVGIELEAVVNEEDVENGYQYLGLNYRTYECVLTTEKIIGECSGFHTNIYFDRDGKFIQQGIWE